MRRSLLVLNLVLLAILTACALGSVNSQHRARKLFTELEREQERARDLDVEYGQLQLEQSTWARHARVEKIAVGSLHMRAPDAKRTQIVDLGPASRTSLAAGASQ